MTHVETKQNATFRKTDHELVRNENLRSYNRAFSNLTVILALQSQRSAHFKAVFNDSLITEDTTQIVLLHHRF